MGSCSAHIDGFARDSMPSASLLPDFAYALPELQVGERFNCVSRLHDRWAEGGAGSRIALASGQGEVSYSELAARVNRCANALVHDLGLKPGNRVLLRGYNSPMMLTAILAVLKAGGIVLPTMPLLRARELGYCLDKAEVRLVLSDHRLADELGKCPALLEGQAEVVLWGEDEPRQLNDLMRGAGYDEFTACDTAADDICLIAFTSGTTGHPKATMHCHRDLISICETYCRHVVRPASDDRFIGSPTLAFTYGLGALVLFPLWAGAATILVEKTAPGDLLPAMARFEATICFSVPAAYRAMLPAMAGRTPPSLRKCISAGEKLPKATFDAWRQATGIRLMDGLGTTEMLHIFIGAPEETIRPGATGRAVPGYDVRVVGDDGRDLPPDTLGRLAVRGPTGCRYLSDERQAKYVENGWNVTGDLCRIDADGYVWYHSRADDLIVSSGYNISGPEVESALLEHPAVAECGVVGEPNAERGQIVKAFVVLRPGFQESPQLTEMLQQHVKSLIAPYKYPRSFEYVTALPRTPTGKLRRFELRSSAACETAMAQPSREAAPEIGEAVAEGSRSVSIS